MLSKMHVKFEVYVVVPVIYLSYPQFSPALSQTYPCSGGMSKDVATNRFLWVRHKTETRNFIIKTQLN